MRSSTNRRSLTVITVTCLLLGGCGQVESIAAMVKLRAALQQEYGEKEIGVNLHNDPINSDSDAILTVTFVNSPLNAQSHEERAKRAQQTADFVRQHYAAINELAEIWVGFLRVKTRYIFVHTSASLDLFAFDKNGKPLHGTGSQQVTSGEPPSRYSDDTMRPRARYLPELKQTEVVITGLQLQGNNQSIALTPHFTVPGDATGLRRSSSYPQSVNFEFSSYSQKSLFPGEPKIIFLSEGKKVFETAAQFSTSKNPEGLFFESLALLVPYHPFHRMTTGKDLAIRIAEQEYKFSDEQLAALREMTEYVKE